MSSPATESTRSVGPYRLIGQIGEGGMGVVYLAQTPEDRRVAVKILRPSVVGDGHGRARLAREVTSLRRVRSPRIAEIYDADPWGDTPYVVMRYVPGPSLREVVDQRGPLTGPALMRFARGLAQALVVVHRADVLHRDVKPSNVLIQEGEPVLIDFGLAQLSDDVTLTQTGWLLGTPGYLAPEILYGDGPTPAADVHAWAATVTFAALGRGPYGTGNSIGIMDRCRRGEFSLDGVPVELSDVLAAALRSDPTNRPTARQLVDWLDARMVRPSEQPSSHPAPSERPPIEWPPSKPAPSERPPWEPAGGPLTDRWTPPAAVDAPGVGSSSPGSPGLGSRGGAATRLAGVPTATAVIAASPKPAGPVSAALPTARESERSWSYRTAAFWVSLLLVVVAGTVVAPLVTFCWVVVAGWGLRTLSIGAKAWRSRRVRHGVRRRDEVMCALLIPWFALRAVGSAVVSALAMAVAGVGLLALARFGPTAAETPALAVGGLTIALLAWLGPLSKEVRRGGQLVTDSLPRSGLATAIIILLLLGIASGLLATQQVVGTSYAPFVS